MQQELQPLETPVLFLIFNRPDLTEKVFGQIRKVRPRQLFIAADGPRATYPDDLEKCKKTREIVLEMIDWKCEVKTLFREKNLGCGLAVSQAITWFFEHVEMGIILEDDCYPDLSFFWFCSQALRLFENHDDLFMISGSSPFKFSSSGSKGPIISKYANVWGWATWKKKWTYFDFNISSIPQNISLYQYEKVYWENAYLALISNKIDSWAFKWQFSMWAHNGKSITSNYNRVLNIGIGSDSTHTKTRSKRLDKLSLPANELNDCNFEQFSEGKNVDYKIFKTYYIFQPSAFNKVRNLISSIIPLSIKNEFKKYLG